MQDFLSIPIVVFRETGCGADYNAPGQVQLFSREPPPPPGGTPGGGNPNSFPPHSSSQNVLIVPPPIEDALDLHRLS